MIIFNKKIKETNSILKSISTDELIKIHIEFEKKWIENIEIYQRELRIFGDLITTCENCFLYLEVISNDANKFGNFDDYFKIISAQLNAYILYFNEFKIYLIKKSNEEIYKKTEYECFDVILFNHVLEKIEIIIKGLKELDEIYLNNK